MEIDQFMKELSVDYLPRIMELFFPDEAEYCDFERRKDLNKELYTESPKGEERFVDMLQEVPYKHPLQSLLLIHVESQQQKKVDFPARMLGYQSMIYLREIERERKNLFSYAEFTEWQNEKLLLSFAFCNYKDDEPISRKEYKVGSPQTYLSCGYTTINLPMLSAKEYLEKDNPVVCALAVFMDGNGISAAELKAGCYRKLLSYRESLTGRQIDLIIYALETYLTLTEDEKEVYQRLISEVYPEVNKLIINPLVEQGRQQGLEQGRQQGEENGFTRGIQKSIQQILSSRFRELPGDLQKKISSLTDVQKLQALLDACLKVESLEELVMNGFFND